MTFIQRCVGSMTDWKQSPISDGTDRANRGLNALEPDYVQVDELLYEELLSMGAGIASSLTFHNLNNEVDGDWGDLFMADEAVIMAMIVSTDPRSLEMAFNAIHPSRYVMQLNFVLDLARKIDFWLSKLHLSSHYSSELLAQKIVSLINSQLTTALRQCLHIHRQLLERNANHAPYDVTTFGSIWQLDLQADPAEQPPPVESTRYQLRSHFQTFNNAIDYIRTLAPAQLKSSLHGGHHEPAIALFMVFLRLYQRAQARVNTFTGRHQEFYYNDVLRTENRSSSPASAYLHIEKVPQGGKVLIPEGTRFSAGKDAAMNEVAYRADHALLVSNTTVSAVATLYLQQDTLVSPECELDYVTRVKSRWLPQQAASADEIQQRWPLFGATSAKSTGSDEHDARIGLAIASPVLKLSQGRRQIELRFSLGRFSTDDMEQRVLSTARTTSRSGFHQEFGRLFAIYLLSGGHSLSTKHKALLIKSASRTLTADMAEEVSSLLTQDWQGLFFKLFRKVFTLSLTGANGWLDVDDYSISPADYASTAIRPGFTLAFTLWHNEDPITAHDSAIHGDEIQASQPVLRCLLNPESNFFPYSLFQGLLLEKVEINVEVQGLTDIIAHNQHGQLDPSKPFHPFGPIPTLNSKFIFGSHEVALKKVTALSLDLEWGQLPKLAGGFGTHYQGYEGDYFNESFVCQAAVLSDGKWLPKGEETVCSYPMFASDRSSSKLMPGHRLTLDVADYLSATPHVVSADKYRYAVGTRNGFFRLEITGPDGAFGHEDYPKLLTDTLSLNARFKKLKHLKPMPNPPYTPVLNSLSINYRASASIDLTRPAAQKGGEISGEVMHLHPFGVASLSPLQGEQLLPLYQHEGNLMIALSSPDVAGELTLFFHLAKDNDDHNESASGPIRWYYLSDNGWERLPDKQVLSDTTDNFITSGVVTLNIPAEISCRNPVMPTGRYWLRATTDSGSAAYPRLIAIKTHAIKVTRQPASPHDVPHVTYDNHGWTLLSPIAGVAAIKQAGELLGGSERETDSERKMRISERLHHKNRALSPWDYEHLVLERFSGIAKVKCFPALSASCGGVTPGGVLLVVLPELQRVNGAACSRVYLDREKLLQIENSIQDLASPFARIEVRNPIYETVQIRCSVKFNRADLLAGLHEQLNRDLSEFICPWSERGYKVIFGWRIRKKEVESYIRSLDYVDYVTNVSMLHITTRDQKQYCMMDTAEHAGDVVVSPLYPWSLPVPAENHFIETTSETRPQKADITGINEIEVGSTFIIDGDCNDG